MKKRIILVFLLFVGLLTSCTNKKAITTSVQATSYIVLEQSNNKILEGFNYYETRSVASISKIMTAIVVIENTNINEVVKVPNDISKVDGSSIYLKVGQEISILDLLYGLLLRSGNDAAITLALATCNTIEDFVLLMNQKASQLNMTRTIFNNPHGLDVDDDGNLSCAYDMAILYSYCLENPLFAKIVGSKMYRSYQNKNKLLRNYKYCTGGKTGFTNIAKRTLVTSASKDNINLIVVTLNCGNDFLTHQNLYEAYFNNYHSIKVLNKGYNSFDNQNFIVTKDYYFVTKENNLSLFYKLNLHLKEIEITLLDENKHVLDYLKVNIKKE